MKRFWLKKGLAFRELNFRWTLLRRLASGKLQFENDLGEIKTLTDSELLQLWNSGTWLIDENTLGSQVDAIYLSTPRDLSTFPERWQKRAHKRLHYINALNPELNKYNVESWRDLIKSAAEVIDDKNPPCPSSVHAWWKKYRVTKSVISLIPRSVTGFERAKNPHYSIFEEILDTIYLNPQQRPIADVVKAVQHKITELNLERPQESQIPMLGKTTIYRWASDLRQDIVDGARLGANAARMKYRISMGGLKVSYVLERVEIDHSPIDLIVYDKNTKLSPGRAWLTLALDKYSRMVVGFYISFGTPSANSVLQCLKCAIMPKDEWLARFPDIHGTWPAFGIPELIATDNGMDLHSDAFKSACMELGIQILYCPAATPQMKGSVERFFRTISQDLIHKLPGTVFSNVDQRGDYPSEEVSAIDLETLTHLIIKWIVEVYNVSFHRGINSSPLRKWLESAEKCRIELPVYPKQLDVIIGSPAKRTVFHYGIELDGLHYNSRHLQEIRRISGENLQVQLKYYEESVASIQVFDPYKKEYLEVEAVDQDYAKDLHRGIHRLARAQARKTYGDNYSQVQLSEARKSIEAIALEAIKDKKMAVRKDAFHLLKYDSVAVLKRDNPIAEAMQPVKSAAPKPPEELPDGLNDDLPDLLSKLAKAMDFANEENE